MITSARVMEDTRLLYEPRSSGIKETRKLLKIRSRLDFSDKVLRPEGLCEVDLGVHDPYCKRPQPQILNYIETTDNRC